MICTSCREQAHNDCIDTKRAHDIPCSYGSCDCQHGGVKAPEPATGEAGE